MKRLLLAVVLLGAVSLAACGGGGSKSSSTTTPNGSPAFAKQRFQTAESAVEKVQNSVAAKLNKVDPNADGAQVLAVLQPLISAATTYQTQLSAIDWPSSMVSASHTLITELGTLVGVMQSVASQTAFSVNTWVSQFESAGSAVHSTTNTLRHDLGLAPLPQ